ncbi:hypothetical protein KKH3_10230 [Pectobacterium actinidiae]|nr:hypothetical protein KKH3_10230 [Pectobacterium actinidiae]
MEFINSPPYFLNNVHPPPRLTGIYLPVGNRAAIFQRHHFLSHHLRVNTQ